MARPICPVCSAPSACEVIDGSLLFHLCTACGWHHALQCACGTMLRMYTGAGPVDGWLCPCCDRVHAMELEEVVG